MADYVSIHTGATIDAAISAVPNKVDAEVGKGLSEANFTNAEKAQLAATIPATTEQVNTGTNNTAFITPLRLEEKLSTGFGTAAQFDVGIGVNDIPQNSNLGTAAFAELTLTPTDTTVSRVMQTGDFGVGGDPAFQTIDFNTQVTPRRVAFNNTSTNNPFGVASGYLDVKEFGSVSPKRIMQFAITSNISGIAYRYGTVNGGVGTFDPWVYLWHTGNLVKTTSATDTTTGRVLQTGDGGVLSLLPLDNAYSWNNSRIKGWNSGGVVDAPSANASLGLDLGYAENRRAQLAIDLGNEMYFRGQQVIPSTSANWRKVWHDGNLVKTTSSTDTTSGRILQVGDGGLLGSYVNKGLTDVSGLTGVIFGTATGSPLGASTSVFGVQSGNAGYAFRVYGRNGRYFAETVENGARGASDELYHNRNILGGVSQSGGIPTGAIIERGSNTNGEYIKFADGTAMTFQVHILGAAQTANTPLGGGYRTGAVTGIPIPMTYVNTNYRAFTKRFAGDSAFETTAAPVTTSSLSLVYSRVTSGNVEVGLQTIIFTIGRWF